MPAGITANTIRSLPKGETENFIQPCPIKARRREQKTDICPNERQHSCPNGKLIMPQVIENIGAGEGNRTLVFSLEGCCSTIELHPRLRDHLTCHAGGLNRPAPGSSGRQTALFRQHYRPFRPLTPANSLPILRFPSTTKGGDSVSLTKRCHLAGIAR